MPRHVCHAGPRPRPRGTTLVEIVTALAVLAITAGVALPRALRLLDHVAVHAAIDAIAGACALARGTAIMRGAYVGVTIDTAAAAVLVIAGSDTLLARRLGDGGALRLGATRSRVVYGPTGLGYGASNTTVIARRGSAADTLFTSRLGRVRH